MNKYAASYFSECGDILVCNERGEIISSKLTHFKKSDFPDKSNIYPYFTPEDRLLFSASFQGNTSSTPIYITLRLKRGDIYTKVFFENMFEYRFAVLFLYGSPIEATKYEEFCKGFEENKFKALDYNCFVDTLLKIPHDMFSLNESIAFNIKNTVFDCIELGKNYGLFEFSEICAPCIDTSPAFVSTKEKTFSQGIFLLLYIMCEISSDKSMEISVCDFMLSFTVVTTVNYMCCNSLCDFGAENKALGRLAELSELCFAKSDIKTTICHEADNKMSFSLCHADEFGSITDFKAPRSNAGLTKSPAEEALEIICPIISQYREEATK